MSRTSQPQFELMVDFMERNGDLNKPADGPHGRLTNVQKWRELTNCLNLDTTGTAKPVDKWKKVWSDFKNNTKRKASKIHRAAGGTGGGPACKLTLTDLEQRVLFIIGPTAATGLMTVEEVGVELVLPPEPSAASARGLPLEEPALLESSTPSQMDIQVETIQEDMNRPGCSSQSTPFLSEVVEAGAATPTTIHAQSPPRTARVNRRISALTPRRTRPTRQRQHISAATEQFLNSDAQWLNLATEFVTENRRLREVELQQQAQWQTLFAKFLNLVENYTKK